MSAATTWNSAISPREVVSFTDPSRLELTIADRTSLDGYGGSIVAATRQSPTV
jgi:hypothetical protein